MKKEYKLTVLLIPFAILLSACAGRINLSDSEPIDNAYGNEFANGSEVEEGLWRTKDALYVRRFLRANLLRKNGTQFKYRSANADVSR